MLIRNNRRISMSDAISRRRVLQGAYGMMAGTALNGLGGRAFALPTGAAGQAAPQNAIPPGDALKRIMAGNARYAANKPEVKDYSAGRAARTTAQYPVAAILSCAD